MAALAHTVLGIRTRISEHWPIEVSDEDALAIGICCCLKNADETVAVLSNRNLTRVVSKNAKSISINDEEFGMIIKRLSLTLVNATPLGSLTWFKEKRDRVGEALKCTLEEKGVAEVWKRVSVQLACVLAMYGTENPILKLDSVLGSVVRSDSRRVDDLHFECLGDPPDPFSLSVCLGVTSSAILT
jgi:hypothetical protein